MDHDAAMRDRMVEQTIRGRGLTDPDVLRAMRTVERHRFVPPEQREFAYEDAPLPIGRYIASRNSGEEQTISQPFIVAHMADLGDVRPGTRVLDIGTGSGYQAAVLAEIGADVYSVEIVPELHAYAQAALAEAGYGRVHLRLGDGKLGWPEHAPYDAILVAAGAEHVPPALVDQLAPGGRLVLPQGATHPQELVVLERTPWGDVRRVTHGAVAFVPLV